MELLNLQYHEPDQFVGTSILIDGRLYEVGPRFRESSQGFAHYLINTLSGLCLHIAQIRCEYRSDPSAARQASLLKAEATARLRTDFKLKAEQVDIPIIRVVDAACGSLELHEIEWGSFESVNGPSALAPRDAIQAAIEQMHALDFAGAAGVMTGILREYPMHTVALLNLASCQGAMGHFVAATSTIEKAITIEPNYALYQSAAIQYALQCPARQNGLRLFELFKARYPAVDDADLHGAHGYMHCGKPEQARALLCRSPFARLQAAGLLESVEAALEARRGLGVLEGRKGFRTDLKLDAMALAELERLYALYPTDPMLQANYGLRLRFVGEHQRAIDLLMAAAGGIAERCTPHCWANAAFSYVELQVWDKAIKLFAAIEAVLSSTGDEIHPMDVPGVTKWIFGDMEIAEQWDPPASAYLDKAIRQCSDRTLITPEIVKLAEIYRDAAKILSTKKKWWQRLW